jgi:hypothetical protein
VSQPWIEEDTRPCCYPPCGGVMELEIDGGQEVWACGTCQNVTYGSYQAAGEDSCQVGMPTAVQQQEPPGAPVFLGGIGRRPQ